MDVDTSKAEDFFQEDTFKAEEIVNLINAIYDARDVYRVGEKEIQTLGNLEEPVEFTTSSGLTIHKGMEASEFVGRKIFAEDIVEIVENLQIGGMYQSGMMGTALVEQAQPDAKTKEEKYQMPIKGSKMYKANMNILAQVYSDITNQITCYNCDVGCFSCTGICGGEACKGACYTGCDGSCVDNDEKSKFGCKETCNLGCSLDCTDDCEACTGCSDSCGDSCYDNCQGCKGSCVTKVAALTIKEDG